MIRFANKYDNDKIIEILKDFMINTKNPMANNPMVWSRTYVENVLKHIKKGTVVCGTRVEPPLHPAGKEKIIENFSDLNRFLYLNYFFDLIIKFKIF